MCKGWWCKAFELLDYSLNLHLAILESLWRPQCQGQLIKPLLPHNGTPFNNQLNLSLKDRFMSCVMILNQCVCTADYSGCVECLFWLFWQKQWSKVWVSWNLTAFDYFDLFEMIFLLSDISYFIQVELPSRSNVVRVQFLLGGFPYCRPPSSNRTKATRPHPEMINCHSPNSGKTWVADWVDVLKREYLILYKAIFFF